MLFDHDTVREMKIPESLNRVSGNSLYFGRQDGRWYPVPQGGKFGRKIVEIPLH